MDIAYKIVDTLIKAVIAVLLAMGVIQLGHIEEQMAYSIAANSEAGFRIGCEKEGEDWYCNREEKK